MNEIREAIKKASKEIFGEKVKVYLFGSRTDLNKKGGLRNSTRRKWRGREGDNYL